MSQPEHVKDPSVEFVKSRLLGAAAEEKFARDPKIYSLAVTLNYVQNQIFPQVFTSIYTNGYGQ
jgi:hypothetical protein